MNSAKEYLSTSKGAFANADRIAFTTLIGNRSYGAIHADPDRKTIIQWRPGQTELPGKSLCRFAPGHRIVRDCMNLGMDRVIDCARTPVSPLSAISFRAPAFRQGFHGS